METIILCIDTCGIKFSVALICNAQLIDEYTCDEIHMQCEKLIIAIETLLSNNNLHYNQINLIAVTSGPGSFNGIRIGMSAAQGISIAMGIKIISVSTMQMILFQAININYTIQFPVAICFMADELTSFIQQFADINDTNQSIIEVNREQLASNYHNLITFDMQNFGLVNANISNAAAAGYAAINRHNLNCDLFYGKMPSIHQSKKSLLL